MRYASTGFHIIMLLLVIAAFAGAFSPAPTGNFAHDAGGGSYVIIGLGVVWIVGAIVLRVAKRLS